MAALPLGRWLGILPAPLDVMAPQSRSPFWLPLALCALSLILCAGLIYRHYTAASEKKRNVASITCYSNQWVAASKTLDEQQSVSLTLEADFAAQTRDLLASSNQLAALSASVTQIEVQAKAAAGAAKEEERQRDDRIAELERQRNGMARNLDDSTSSIANLESQIANAELQLRNSEGDREGLLKEINRLRIEKSELERKFHDLAQLRQQVRKLREELSISHRLEWIRRGLYGRLNAGDLLAKDSGNALAQPDFNLAVEIRRDGGATVLSATNSVPTKGSVGK